MAFDADDLRALLRALSEDPEARAELSRMVEREEIRALTVEVHALAEAQRRTEANLDRLTGRVDSLAEQMVQLTGRVDSLAEQMQQLTSNVAGLQNVVADLRGQWYEWRYTQKANRYLHSVAYRPMFVDPAALNEMLDAAIAGGRLTQAEAGDVYAADAVLRGRRKADLADVYLVVEVSAAIDARDVARAVRRARLLERTGVTVMPVVAGMRLTPGGEEAARREKVPHVLDADSEPPDPAEATAT